MVGNSKPKIVTMPYAFGSSAPRFRKVTLHTELAHDPCLYHPISITKIYEVNKNRRHKDVWRFKAEMEEWSKNLGYRNQAILRERRWRAACGGPADTEVHEPKKYEPACKNLGFGRAPRSRPTKFTTPGPGRYYQSEPFKSPHSPHTNVQSFDWGEPCRFKSPGQPWSLAPDRYIIVDKESIEMKSKKLVSLRGPYDLFTGERDMTSIKNHFAVSSCHARTWPLTLPGCFEGLKKSHYGEMNKTGRDKPFRGREVLVNNAMALRIPSEPGPADLHLTPAKVFKLYKYGFNSSYDRPPGYKRVIIWPGVGRYNPHPVSCGLPGKGHKFVFKSKVERTPGFLIPEKMNSF